jgi:hypothetical protein
MTVPHYISENQSDMRGIKHGWYAIEDDGCNKGRTEHFSKPVYRHPALRAAPGGLLKPAL